MTDTSDGVVYKYYGLDGEVVDDEESAYAKHRENLILDTNRYFIKIDSSNGILINPDEIQVRTKTRWKEVQKSTFDEYCGFLDNKSNHIITRLRREI